MRNALYEGYPGFYDREWRGGEWARKQTRWQSMPSFLDLDLSQQALRRTQELTKHACLPVGAGHSHKISILSLFMGYLGSRKTAEPMVQGGLQSTVFWTG